jgi:predicted nuclease with TOPRIM domain
LYNSIRPKITHQKKWRFGMSINSMSSVTAAPVAQTNHQDTFGRDPITQARLTDPVIDEAGHTFNKKTIDDLMAKLSPGEPLVCPIGKEVIHVDRLVRNRLAVEAAQRAEQKDTEVKELKEIVVQLAGQMQNISGHMQIMSGQMQSMGERYSDLTLVTVESIQRGRRTELQYEELTRLVQNLRADNADLKAGNVRLAAACIRQENELRFIRADNARIEASNTAMENRIIMVQQGLETSKTQIQNIVNMSFGDKFYTLAESVFGSNEHLKTVINRGIPENSPLRLT